MKNSFTFRSNLLGGGGLGGSQSLILILKLAKDMALGGPIYLESDGCLSHFDTTECYFSQLRDFIITEC